VNWRRSERAKLRTDAARRLAEARIVTPRTRIEGKGGKPPPGARPSVTQHAPPRQGQGRGITRTAARGRNRMSIAIDSIPVAAPHTTTSQQRRPRHGHRHARHWRRPPCSASGSMAGRRSISGCHHGRPRPWLGEGLLPAPAWAASCAAGAVRRLGGILTGWLLAVSLPPWAPWWIGAFGGLFATVLAKQVFGGLGQNLFNPAMVARVALLISFPVQMTAWVAPLPIFGAWRAGTRSTACCITLNGVPPAATMR
jgi:hypothetical protein